MGGRDIVGGKVHCLLHSRGSINLNELPNRGIKGREKRREE